MQTPATPPVVDPLALPADQFALERVIDASIAVRIAYAEWIKAISGSARRAGLACVFRNTTESAMYTAWREFLDAGRYERQLRAIATQQVAA